MQFQPRSEEELDVRTVLPRGEYFATVTKATDEVSKSKGNEQIHLVLKVDGGNAGHNSVHDYLLEAMAGKLRHFCDSANLMDEYKSGDLVAANCVDQLVRVKLDIEPASNGYPEKNVIRDYLAMPATPPAKQSGDTRGDVMGHAAQSAKAKAQAGAAKTKPPFGNEEVFADDDIPF